MKWLLILVTVSSPVASSNNPPIVEIVGKSDSKKECLKQKNFFEKEGKYLGITGIGFGHILCVKDMEK